MEKILKMLLVAFLLLVGVEHTSAQLGDPVLAATWKKVTKTETAAVSASTAATMATIPTIKWYSSETRDYVNFRKKYYLYLDSIQGKLLLYVNAVGLGVEVNDLIKACKMVSKELVNNTDNFFAVSFSSQKRQAIIDVVGLIGELSNMIGVAGQKAKVKETKRYKILQDIRLKMRELTTKIRVLAFNIHYTNFYQLWYSLINEYEIKRCNKRNIARECANRWIITAGGKNIKY